MTLPWTEETATMSTFAVWLFGVKVTLNKLAEKPEFSWQAFNELDWRIGSARAGEASAATDATAASGRNDDHRISFFAENRKTIAVEMEESICRRSL
jgi:hypothetical protein